MQRNIIFVLVQTVYKWLSASFFFHASYYTLLSKCSLSHAVWGTNCLKPTSTDQLSKRPACLSSIKLWDTARSFPQASGQCWSNRLCKPLFCQVTRHQHRVTTPGYHDNSATHRVIEKRAASLLVTAADGDNTASRAQMIMNGQMFQRNAECLKMVIRKNVSIKNHGWVIFRLQNQKKIKPILKDIKMFFCVLQKKDGDIIYIYIYNKNTIKYILSM